MDSRIEILVDHERFPHSRPGYGPDRRWAPQSGCTRPSVSRPASTMPLHPWPPVERRPKKGPVYEPSGSRGGVWT